MGQAPEGESAMKQGATVERTSERELVVTRTIDGPPHLVFKAWSDPELFRQWWVPKSFGVVLASCEMDVRTGGRYRLVFGEDPSQQMAFVGQYVEVVPNSRIVWTNEEEDDGAITTVTFEDQGGRTRVVVRDFYASKEAVDEALASGSVGGLPDQLDQLDALVRGLGAGVGE
ncbi:MAG: SRPBCC family protein [Gemmatimonadota bacterium]